VLTLTYNAARFVLDIRRPQPGVAKTQDTTRHTFIKWLRYIKLETILVLYLFDFLMPPLTGFSV